MKFPDFMPRILLTGGTGFFGKSLLLWLLVNNIECELWIISRKPQEFMAANPWFYLPNCYLIPGSILDCQLPGGAFDYVIHAATIPAKDSEIEYFTIKSTRRMLDFCQHSGAKMLYLSSGAVYGKHYSVDSLTEDTDLQPFTAYGVAKAKAEELILKTNVTSVIARCFAFIGPFIDYHIHYAAGDFLLAAQHGQPIKMTGNGQVRRSYLDADDWAEWCLQLLVNGNGIYNVGSNHAVSTLELAQTIQRTYGRKEEIQINSAAPGEDWCYIPDINKIKHDLAVQPTLNLTQSIEKIININKFLASGD